MPAKIYPLGDGNRGPRGGKIYVFHCPGCLSGHPFEVCPEGWQWNGSLDRPTVTPSLVVNGQDPTLRCHSFVRDGRIQFLGDSHHILARQTVDLPDWDAVVAEVLAD